MSRACCEIFGAPAPGASAAAFSAAEWLALAASPTFAGMALLSGILGSGAADMICSSSDMSPMSGMAAMYLLMGVFHAAPWLRLVRQRKAVA